MIPGAYDALSARLAVAAGFRCVYMSGFGVSAGRAALPDAGLLTMSEMVDQAAAIVEATSVPVLADADTGYGSPANVARTIRQYEQAGAAGVHLEDSLWPRDGQRVTSRRSMIARVEAAVGARRDDSFVIVGRTDAYDTLGLAEAIDRVLLLENLGVDAIFVHSLTTREQFLRVRDATSIPLVANVVDGLTEVVDKAEFAKLGYDAMICSVSALRAVMRAALNVYRELAETGYLHKQRESLLSIEETVSFLGATTSNGAWT